MPRAAVCPTRLLALRRSPRRAAPSAAASRRDARPSVAGTVARRAAVQSHSQPRGSLWLSALLHCVRPRPALWIAMDAAWMAMTVVAEAGPPRPHAPPPCPAHVPRPHAPPPGPRLALTSSSAGYGHILPARAHTHTHTQHLCMLGWAEWPGRRAGAGPVHPRRGEPAPRRGPSAPVALAACVRACVRAVFLRAASRAAGSAGALEAGAASDALEREGERERERGREGGGSRASARLGRLSDGLAQIGEAEPGGTRPRRRSTRP